MKIRWEIVFSVLGILLVLYVGFYIIEDVAKNIDEECCNELGGELEFVSCHVGFINKECGNVCRFPNGTGYDINEFRCKDGFCCVDTAVNVM